MLQCSTVSLFWLFFNAGKIGVGLFENKSPLAYSRIRRLLRSPRIRLSHGPGLLKRTLMPSSALHPLASLNSEKKGGGLSFEEKSISGASIGSACHTAKAY